MAANGALIARCAPFIEKNEFIRDVLRKAEANARLSEKQMAALEKAVARLEADDARKATAAFVGEVGERLKGLVVNVVRVASFEGHFGMFHITTLRTPDGNTFVVKSGSFKEQEGDTLIIDGTVKVHDTFRDERQTQLARVTVKENITPETEIGVAA